MSRLLSLLAVGLVGLPLFAADDKPDPLDNWGAWRGPLHTGEAPRGKPPLSWDAKTNVAWKTPIPGRGASTPIVWGDRVFVLTAIDTGKQADAKDIPKLDARAEGMKKMTKAPTTYHRFEVLCLDRKTGKVKWQKTCAEKVPHEGHHTSHSYAAGSPVTDGKRLIVSFGSFGIYGFDLDGKKLWERDFGRMATRLGWGEAVTPALHKGRVYLTWDQEADSFIAALNADTGKDIWKIERDEPTSWATPLVVEHAGKTQVVTPGTKRVRSYDAEDGKVIWYHSGLTVNCIPSPLAREGVVYVMSGYKGSVAAAVPLGSSGNATEKVLWRLEQGTPYVPSPLLVGKRLYFTQTNDAILSCIDIESGKQVIDRVRLRGVRSFYASPVAAGGRIYLTDRDGVTLVIEQSDTLKILATNTLGEPIDASPAVVGKQLFLRGEKHVWCIEEK